jgi:two-component system chemotaxis response regulator CheY
VANASEISVRQLAARFAGLGISVEPLPGGRCLRGRLRVTAEPFVTVAGARRYETISFATVGSAQIKCLAPLPFFFLPLITLGGCTSAADLEGRIRAAWAARERDLRSAARRMREIGLAPAPEAGGQVLCFPLGHDDACAAVRAFDDKRLILPSRGPLTGLRATAPEQRSALFDAAWHHASDAEIALTDRLEKLREQLAGRRASLPSGEAASPTETPSRPPPRPLQRGRRLLLVGSRLGRDSQLVRQLEQRGFRVQVEFSAHEALGAFRTHSYELVFADSHLGRSEGIELITDLRALPGIENVPVVLVDEHRREAVREAARRVGAAGYLVHPLDGERIAPGIERTLNARTRRRYRRLPWRLSVRVDDGRSAFTTSVARLGAFLGLDWGEPLATLRRCDIELPELGRVLRADVQGIYRVDAAGAQDAGVGVLFRAFGSGDEAAWIEYLSELFASSAAERRLE